MRFFFLLTQFLILFCAIAEETDLEKSAILSLRSGLYDDAAACYRALMEQTTNTNHLKQLRGQLAYCLHHLRASQELVQLLEGAADRDDGEKLYLASAYRRLGRFEDALNFLENDSIFDCSFEKALVYYESGAHEKAYKAFKLLADKKESEPALLYLTRLDMSQNALETAKKHLNQVDGETFSYEKNYLRGVIAMMEGDYSAAIYHLEKALPSPHAPWSAEASLQLARAYLKTGGYNHAIAALSSLKPCQRTHEITLTLAEALFAEGSDNSYNEAIALLDRSMVGHEGWLLRARWGNSYHERDTHFRRLTHESNSSEPRYGEWWLQRGIHDLSEAHRHTNEERQRLVQQAKDAFTRALKLLPSSQEPTGKLWLGNAYLLEGSKGGAKEAQKIFCDLLTHEGAPSDQGTFFYMYVRALMAEQRSDLLDMETLHAGIELYPSPEGEFLLAILYYQRGEWQQAKRLFLSVASQTKGVNAKQIENPLHIEALFWAAKASIDLGEPSDQYRPLLKQVYETDHDHPLAGEAYFIQYAYEEYLRGNREAMRHLERLPSLFPNHYLGINSYYLIGLDRKRDRPSNDGTKIHRRDLNGAIEAFHRAEELHDRLYSQERIPKDKSHDAATLRYYAALERGLANLGIAEESEGAKRRIFLEYAQDVFKKILANHSLLQQHEPYSPIEEESTFWLAKAYTKAGDLEQAKATFDHMQERYREATITRGYFLARMWIELGEIALNEQQYRSALDRYDAALEAAKGGVLSNDERLSVWIQKSACYRGLEDYPAAIRILTQVTNENVISGLRLKAMYLRSQLYALQGRAELERNQLKALAKKGGEWAAKARLTLEAKYGY